jgi:hypothetical protein
LTDDNKDWLLSYVSGQNFYNKKLKFSEDTATEYIRRLRRYCKAVDKTPDELIKLKPTHLELAVMLQKGISAEEINENAAEDLLESFLARETIYDERSKQENPFTPNVKLGILNAVKSFYLATRGRELASDVGENIEAPPPKKRTPSIDECVMLDEAMTTHRDRFLVWFLESCPVRQGTLRKLVWKDLKPLDDPQVPYWISIEAARLKGKGLKKYKGAKHIGFLHYLAVQKLEAYKQELKQRHIEYTEDSPIFMAYNNNPWGQKIGGPMQHFNRIFSNASEMAFKDFPKTRYSPQDFRDIISTIVEKPQVKANVNLAKPLTSHKPSGVEAIYANHPDNDYLELFKMCMPFLIPKTVEEVEAERQRDNAEHKQIEDRQQQQIDEANKKIEEINEKFNQVDKTCDGLIEYMKAGVHVLPAKDNELLRFVSKETWDEIQSIKDKKLREKAIEELKK